MTAPNEELIALQNKIADLTESLATTQGLVTKINSIVSDISSTLTNTNTTITSLGAATPLIISPNSRLSIGPELAAIGAAWASGITFSSNDRCYIPFSITETKTAISAFTANGSGTIAGNVEVSIYSEALAKLVSTGSVAHAGASAMQILSLADTALTAGRYYMSFSLDDGTTTMFRTTTLADMYRPLGVLFEAAAFTAPATATPAVMDNNIPMFGIIFSSAIV